MEFIKKLFVDATFKWYQISIFKLSMVSLGVAVGAYWHDFFRQFVYKLLLLFLFTGLYMLLVWFRQIK